MAQKTMTGPEIKILETFGVVYQRSGVLSTRGLGFRYPSSQSFWAIFPKDDRLRIPTDHGRLTRKTSCGSPIRAMAVDSFLLLPPLYVPATRLAYRVRPSFLMPHCTTCGHEEREPPTAFNLPPTLHLPPPK